jgi:tetratricopeptide (TPR) repeat protein
MKQQVHLQQVYLLFQQSDSVTDSKLSDPKFTCFKSQVLRALAVLFASIIVAAHPLRLTAQADTVIDARVRATQLRDSGDFAGASRVLRAHLETYPDDGDALRLLAQTLYWSKDFAAAKQISERALAVHPEDTELRVQYARMLIETGFSARAREVLANVTPASTGGRSDAILATVAYWEGDLPEAERLSRSAIASGDTDPAVRRIHADIAVLTAPWFALTPAYQHDDQPIDRVEIAGEAGWFPAASTSFAVHAQGLRFQLADTASRSAALTDITLSHYAAAARTELELSAGAVQRSFGAASDVTGSAAIAFRLPVYVSIGARAYRAPYFATEASLSRSVMTNNAYLYSRLDSPAGWLGEIAYRYARYPDANALTSAYLWLLAPIVHSPALMMRAGYSGALQNSSVNHFSLTHPTQPFLPGNARFDLSGSYQPYYTPMNLQSHSVIASIGAQMSSVASFNANGSYAIRATEDHPVLLVTSTTSPVTSTVQQRSYVRTFNPWNAHASLQLNPSTDVSVVAAGEILKTGFYTASAASLSLVYRFASRAMTRAGGY